MRTRIIALVGSLWFVMLAMPGLANAGTLNLAWDASSGATGYIVWVGTQSGVYTGQVNVGNQTTASISGLTSGGTYYFVVQSYNGVGSSPFSAEVSGYVAPTAADPLTNYTLQGRPEIVWQNDSGTLVGWFMNGTTMMTGPYLNPSSTADSNWRVIAMADFNLDGTPDLLWQHQVTGQLVVWFMRGNAMLSAALLNPSASTDLNWKVVGVGDLDGDGHPDLLWQNKTTGGLIAWFMNGTVLTSARWLNPSSSSDLNWTVVGLADMNGDGWLDLVWRNTSTGGLITWFMNGTVRIGAQFLSPSSVSDLTWKIAAIR